jgi:hypothetical protein
LESVKRDSKREDDIPWMETAFEACQRNQLDKTLGEEIEIFEESQNPQVDGDAEEEESPFAAVCARPRDLSSTPIVQKDRKIEKPQKPPIPGSVKNGAGHKQKQILSLPPQEETKG